MKKTAEFGSCQEEQKGYSLKISMEPGGSGFLRENENMQNDRTS